jgi:hypothetical protein
MAAEFRLTACKSWRALLSHVAADVSLDYAEGDKTIRPHSDTLLDFFGVSERGLFIGYPGQNTS